MLYFIGGFIALCLYLCSL